LQNPMQCLKKAFLVWRCWLHYTGIFHNSSSVYCGGLEFKSASSIQPYITELKDKTDLVVVLAHDSAYQDSKTGSITGPSVVDIASYKPDALITGHSHTQVAGFIDGVPTVQAWYNGVESAV